MNTNLHAGIKSFGDEGDLYSRIKITPDQWFDKANDLSN